MAGKKKASYKPRGYVEVAQGPPRSAPKKLITPKSGPAVGPNSGTPIAVPS
jgi:hypothetical protein